MSWVKEAVNGLKHNQTVRVRPHGGSMRGRIESGQLVTISPVSLEEIEIGDVIFIRWKGNYLLHLVKDIEPERILIGNNLGKINGWIAVHAVIGKVTGVEKAQCVSG